MAGSLYTSDNPVFASYCFYAAVLCVKMLLMAPLTGQQRFRKKAFASPEDTKLTPGGKLKTDDDVERIRRAHLNDLENIVPFLVLAFVYVGTNPSLVVARMAFRIFCVARVVHTIVYALYVIPQPARALAFMGGMVVNAFMAFSVIGAYLSFM